MNLAQVIARATGVYPSPLPSVDTFLPQVTLNGVTYPLRGIQQTLTGSVEEIGRGFQGLVEGAYKADPVVYAVELARMYLFMQARFQFRQLRSGRPGDYFGDRERPNSRLALLDRPWPGATTGDLLARMIQFADFGGDAFVIQQGDRLRIRRPDWVTVVVGSPNDPEVTANDVEAEEIGILYHPGGLLSGKTPEVFLAGEYAHFAPIPDPLNVSRGMPWLMPVVREIEADLAATSHKLKFFTNGATVNLVVQNVPGQTREEFDKWVALFEGKHKGLDNAFKTLYLSGATTATPIGTNLEQADFRAVQGAGEVRICIAGGVPPTVVGVSEGLQGSSLNAGNFAQAMRRFADLTMRPLWQNAAGSLEAICPAPRGSQLWYDDRDIPALKDDIKDAALVQQAQAQSIKTLIDAGYKPDSVVAAVTAGDFKRLDHTGLFSVQLQPPGTPAPNPQEPAPATPPAVPGRDAAALLAALTRRS